MRFMRERSDGIVLKVFVQPKSSKNMIAGPHGDALKIRLTAPPVDGAANKMCVKYLSKCLGIPKSSIEILSGHTSRTKQIFFRFQENIHADAEKEDLKRRIIAVLPQK